MRSIFSILRSSLLLIIALLSLVLSLTINEFGFFFGVALLMGGALTAIYLFIHFDETLNEKVIMEALIDVFSGLVILTFPEISQRFVMVDFSFWMAMMGILYLSGGFFNHKKSNYFWLYVLTGLAMIIFGFIIMNYSPETLGSANYLMSFAIILYGMVGIYLSIARKKVPFQ